jgi:hypothetical protein
LSAVFPIGNERVIVDRDTLTAVRVEHEYRGEVFRAAGPRPRKFVDSKSRGAILAGRRPLQGYPRRQPPQHSEVRQY